MLSQKTLTLSLSSSDCAHQKNGYRLLLMGDAISQRGASFLFVDLCVELRLSHAESPVPDSL